MPLDARTVHVGQELPPLDKGAITREMLKEYGPAAGDPNPIHVDDEFAKNAGYPGVFAHGMLSMGYLGEFLHRAAGGVANVRKFRARFTKLTWPGDVVSCKGVVTAVRDEPLGSRSDTCLPNVSNVVTRERWLPMVVVSVVLMVWQLYSRRGEALDGERGLLHEASPPTLAGAADRNDEAQVLAAGRR